MNEGRAFALILVAGSLLTVVGVLGLAALGVRGVGLSLGALIPLALGANAISRVVMHYGESGKRDR
jgi:hypothetical protein